MGATTLRIFVNRSQIECTSKPITCSCSSAFLSSTRARRNITSAKRRIWDANGTFNGPKEMISDPTLRNVILNSDDCNQVDDFSGMGDRTWIALRTPTPVNDRGRVLKRSIVEIAIKLDANATAPGSALIAFITGGWKDGGTPIKGVGVLTP